MFLSHEDRKKKTTEDTEFHGGFSTKIYFLSLSSEFFEVIKIKIMVF